MFRALPRFFLLVIKLNVNWQVREGCFPEEFAQLEQLAFPLPWLVGSFEQANGRFFFSIWETESCVCYIQGRQTLDVVELWRIATHPVFRRQGLGSQLLECFIVHCQARAVSCIQLEVAEGNLAAIAFYRAHGFENVGRRSAYYLNGTNALLFDLHFPSFCKDHDLSCKCQSVL